jgi:glycosyltransferase involved in cell wall biosynthesis
MSKKTLIILTPAFPINESDTSWVPAQQLLVKELIRQFPELNIVVLSFIYPYEEKEYHWYGAKVFAFDGIHKRKLKRISLWYLAWKNLKEIKKTHDVVGILSFWCSECAFVGEWFAYWHKLKHYSWICGQDARKTNKYVKWVRPKAEELIAISDFLVDEFQKNHGVRPAHLIPIAIDTKMFPGLPQSRDVDIIGAGSFSFQKNYDQFVSIIAELKKKFPSIKAIHCGSGEDKENIIRLVEKFDLSQNLTLLGVIPHQEVLKWMQRSKILLHPSSYEGFGLVYLEALYAGAHAIGFTKAMNHEIKNWHIVKTEQEMVEKCSEILQTDVRPERVLVYSIDETAKAFMKLLDQE